jgi:hypothetical protein
MHDQARDIVFDLVKPIRARWNFSAARENAWLVLKLAQHARLDKPERQEWQSIDLRKARLKKAPGLAGASWLASVQRRSVPRDERSRTEGIVEASSDNMVTEAYVQRVCFPAKVGLGSKINVQVFQLRGPIRSEFLL